MSRTDPSSFYTLFLTEWLRCITSHQVSRKRLILSDQLRKQSHIYYLSKETKEAFIPLKCNKILQSHLTMTDDSTDSQQTATVPPKKEEEVKPPSPAAVPKGSSEKKSDAARYAALRNHRIRLEDAIDPDAERVSRILKKDILFGRGKGFQVRIRVKRVYLPRFRMLTFVFFYRTLEPPWQSTNERDC